jgi:hypothetical protein
LKHREQLEAVIKGIVEENVAKEFGLTIEVTNIHRQHTLPELEANQLRIGRYEARFKLASGYIEDETDADLLINSEKVAQLKKLLERRTRITTMEGTEEEAQELDQKIKDLRNELASESIPSTSDVENMFLPASARQDGLRDFRRLLAERSSEQAGNNNKHEESSE